MRNRFLKLLPIGRRRPRRQFIDRRSDRHEQSSIQSSPFIVRPHFQMPAYGSNFATLEKLYHNELDLDPEYQRGMLFRILVATS